MGCNLKKKKKLLWGGSQIIFGLEQMIEKGKGCVCERESSKAGRGKVKGERGGPRGNKDRHVWVVGHTLKRDHLDKKTILVLFLEALNLYLRVC